MLELGSELGWQVAKIDIRPWLNLDCLANLPVVFTPSIAGPSCILLETPDDDEIALTILHILVQQFE